MDFASLARRATRFAAHNSPAILTTIGVVGSITTAYLAGKASFEAAGMIHLKEAEDEVRGVIIPSPREQTRERVELVWKLYVPAIGVGCATVACIIAANHMGARKAAGLAAAYTITEKTLEEYKAKVVEKLGEKKEAQIEHEIMTDRVQKNPMVDGILINGKPDGEYCYDKYSDRYFYNTVNGLQAAVNEFNVRMLSDGYASLSELYDLIGLPGNSYSYEVGWKVESQLLELRIVPVLSNEGTPILTVGFSREPHPNYGSFH